MNVGKRAGSRTYRIILGILGLLVFVSTGFPAPITGQSHGQALSRAHAAFENKDLRTALEWSIKAYKEGSSAESKAEALYLTGIIARAVAKSLSAQAFKDVKPRDGGYWDEDFVNWAGLGSYDALGLRFQWSHAAQAYQYDGAAFKRIVDEYSRTTWACSASFRLYVLGRTSEWEGDIKSALDDIAAMENFFNKCAQAETKCAILYRLVSDHRYLTEVYSDPRGRAFSTDKAESSIKKAEAQLKQIDDEYSDWEDPVETASLRDDLMRCRERLGRMIRK